MAELKRWWVSWIGEEGSFEYHGPWWVVVSGWEKPTEAIVGGAR